MFFLKHLDSKKRKHDDFEEEFECSADLVQYIRRQYQNDFNICIAGMFISFMTFLSLLFKQMKSFYLELGIDYIDNNKNLRAFVFLEIKRQKWNESVSQVQLLHLTYFVSG